jgi:DNA-binding CsgD family transcriptional regulator
MLSDAEFDADLCYSQITPALVQTLGLIRDGLRTRAIAEQRGVSYHTARTHIGALEQITHCHSLDELRAWWEKHESPFAEWRARQLRLRMGE